MTPGDYRNFYQNHLDGEIGKINTSGWTVCLCPFHDDTNPSMNVNFLQQGAFKCHTCNTTGDIFTFIEKQKGLDFKNALKYLADFLNIDTKQIKKSSKPKKKKLGKQIAVYSYYSLDGKEVHQTVKYDSLTKQDRFRQRRPHPSKPDEYLWSLKGIKTVPYNLPDFKTTDIIYIVEGEKDADRLKQIGIVASCNAMGAGIWPDNLTPYFKDKKVIILPDNDAPGNAHADLVAHKLKDVADLIMVVKLPNLKPEGDVSDWLNAGNTKADLIEVIKGAEPYESHIEYLNKRSALIMISGKCCVLNEEYDPVFNRPDVTFSSVQDFQSWYRDHKIPNPKTGKGQPKLISIAKDWLDSPDKRKFNRIIFAPNNTCPDMCYNLWKGFAVEPKKGDWSKFRHHIYTIISSEKDYIFNWIMAWMARIVQDPGGKRPGTAIVLRGEQGVGKGCFLSEFGKTFGNHFMQINNQKQLTSRFNSHLKNVLFLFVDEGFWAGDKSAEGVIKGIITEDLLVIEAKGKDVFVLENHINLALASNNEWVVPSGLDERRFFVIDVSSGKKQDTKYFKKIFDEMKNGGREAMLFDLLKHDRSKIDLRKFPRTAALLDQIVESMSPVHKFWFEKMRSGQLMPHDIHWTELIKTETLYEQYVEFCEMIGIRRKKIDKQFGKELKQICSGLTRRNLKVVINENDIDNSTYKWHYEFPGLEKCREYFEKAVSIELDWDSDEIFFNGEFSGI